MTDWKEVKETWLPVVEFMETEGMNDYAIPEIYRAAEDRRDVYLEQLANEEE